MYNIIVLHLFISFAFSVPNTLFPDKELQEQIISPGDSRIYSLEGLQANTAYEVRVSYPATVNLFLRDSNNKMPANFEISFVNAKLQTRKLLNTEKLMFRTDENAKVMGETLQSDQKSFKIIVSVHREAVSINEEAMKRAIQFNIVLETLFDVGVYAIPYEVFKMAAIVAPALFIIFVLVIPQLLAFFQALSEKDHIH